MASLVVLKGRRRVGKTRLIYEFANDFSASYFFSGLPPDIGVTQKSQKKEFARQLSGYVKRPISKKADDWGDLFDELATLSKDEPVLIFLDEVSWMAKGDPTFLGKLKNVWDLKLKRNPNLFLVVCSSISSWIDKNLLSSTGFVGRISMQKHIKPLSLKESLGFWQNSQVSADEKLEILSTMGCIPRYLEEIDFGQPLSRIFARYFSPIAVLCSESLM